MARAEPGARGRNCGRPDRTKTFFLSLCHLLKIQIPKKGTLIGLAWVMRLPPQLKGWHDIAGRRDSCLKKGIVVGPRIRREDPGHAHACTHMHTPVHTEVPITFHPLAARHPLSFPYTRI